MIERALWLCCMSAADCDRHGEREEQFEPRAMERAVQVDPAVHAHRLLDVHLHRGWVQRRPRLSVRPESGLCDRLLERGRRCDSVSLVCSPSVRYRPNSQTRQLTAQHWFLLPSPGRCPRPPHSALPPPNRWHPAGNNGRIPSLGRSEGLEDCSARQRRVVDECDAAHLGLGGGARRDGRWLSDTLPASSRA